MVIIFFSTPNFDIYCPFVCVCVCVCVCLWRGGHICQTRTNKSHIFELANEKLIWLKKYFLSKKTFVCKEIVNSKRKQFLTIIFLVFLVWNMAQLLLLNWYWSFARTSNGVFRTQLNIYDGFFLQKLLRAF